VHGGDSFGYCAIHQAHTVQAVQLRIMHDMVAIFGVGGYALPANGLHHLHRHGITHKANHMAQVARDVLTDVEVAWVQERSDIIRSLAAGEFSGNIPVDERDIYERLAQKVIGFSFMVCWTCGASLKNLGTYLQTALD